jgi:hypothetical protein
MKMTSEFTKIKAIVLVLKKKFPDLGDERAVYIAYEILEELRKLDNQTLGPGANES